MFFGLGKFTDKQNKTQWFAQLTCCFCQKLMFHSFQKSIFRAAKVITVKKIGLILKRNIILQFSENYY